MCKERQRPTGVQDHGYRCAAETGIEADDGHGVQNCIIESASVVVRY